MINVAVCFWRWHMVAAGGRVARRSPRSRRCIASPSRSIRAPSASIKRHCPFRLSIKLTTSPSADTYCKLPTLSDNHFAPDLRDRRPSSPRPRSGARFCACFSLPTSATGGGAFQERGMCPYLLSLKVGSLRYSQATLGYTSEGKERTTQRRERCSGISPRGADKHGANLRKHSAVADIRTSARQPDSPSASDGSHRERSDGPRSWWHPQRGC